MNGLPAFVWQAFNLAGGAAHSITRTLLAGFAPILLTIAIAGGVTLSMLLRRK